MREGSEHGGSANPRQGDRCLSKTLQVSLRPHPRRCRVGAGNAAKAWSCAATPCAGQLASRPRFCPHCFTGSNIPSKCQS